MAVVKQKIHSALINLHNARFKCSITTLAAVSRLTHSRLRTQIARSLHVCCSSLQLHEIRCRFGACRIDIAVQRPLYNSRGTSKGLQFTESLYFFSAFRYIADEITRYIQTAQQGRQCPTTDTARSRRTRKSRVRSANESMPET